MSTTAAISVVMLPSMIAERAFEKPLLTADSTVMPIWSSSLIRANMITLASTAIPIARMIPAIPGSVMVISRKLMQRRSIIVYATSASDAQSPGILYTIIIKSMIRDTPMIPALIDVAIASEPSWAPTTLERSSESSSLSPPIRILWASMLASVMERIPEIWALPPAILSFTFGTERSSPS